MKRKNGKSAEKNGGVEIYHTGILYRGQYNMDKTESISIYHKNQNVL